MRTLAKIWIATCCCVALALAGCGDPGDGGSSGSDGSDGGFDLTSCQRGETKQVDCNTCFCDEDATWTCTEIACGDAGGADDAGSSDADTSGQCQPGDEKQVDCNSCYCDQNGLWACTAMACLDAGPGDAGDAGECQDGDEKQVDCNTCYCSQGSWACTEIACGDAGPGDDYDPCEDKACGAGCTVCPPDDPNCVETDVVKFCQSDGSCSSNQPSCEDKPECQQDSDCVVSGCSGQVCAAEPQATTCEWREEYACYQEYGDCGCNEGSCGWAQTDDLVQCLGE